MTSSDPLGAAIDQSFGDGPPGPSPADHLVAGRRALRRRRGAAAVASAVAVAVVTAGAALALDDRGPGPGPGGGLPAASQGTGATTATTSPATTSPGPTSPSTPAQEPAHSPTDIWIEDGALHTGAAVETRQVVEDPFALDEPSFAVSADIDGTPFYVSLAGDEVVMDRARPAVWFEQWLATTPGPTGDLLALVRFGDAEVLEPVRGRTVVEQTPDVDLPESFAGPDDLTAAATVDFAGERWFVLARRSAGATS